MFNNIEITFRVILQNITKVLGTIWALTLAPQKLWFKILADINTLERSRKDTVLSVFLRKLA